MEGLGKIRINQFYGVPDSLLKDFCGFIENELPPNRHLIMANEGNAIAAAAGHYLASGNPALVYMQNSGIGNAVNPLLSLAGRNVYAIPMVLLIGWRGEPGTADEPQHMAQGSATLKQLALAEVPFLTVGQESSTEFIAEWTSKHLEESAGPVALVVKAKTFERYDYENKAAFEHDPSREEVLAALSPFLSEVLVVSTTGKTSRELFELRKRQASDQSDFLMVGAMGHASSLALGLAIESNRNVVCIDGDGALLMHMGALGVIGQAGPSNFTHVLLNNASHESVGGQPTAAQDMSFENISLGSGYRNYEMVNDLARLPKTFKNLLELDGPNFLEIKIRTGSRGDLGRPTTSPVQNKRAFMTWVSRS